MWILVAIGVKFLSGQYWTEDALLNPTHSSSQGEQLIGFGRCLPIAILRVPES
jgi:hypothetical protein